MVDMSVADQASDSNAQIAWRALVDKALKGAPFDSLRTVTADGVVLEPVYGAAPPIHAGRPNIAPWQVVCRVDDDTAPSEQAQTDLENGATALALTLAGAAAAGGRGVTACDVAGFDRTLAHIHLNLIALHLEAGAHSAPALASIVALLERRGTRAGALHAGVDPLGAFLAEGTMVNWADTAAQLATLVAGFQALNTPGTLLRADGRMVHEAGGTAIDELAFAVASMAATVRALDERGHSPAVTLPLIAMALAADVDQPTTIAKLRAARRLHALFARACGVETPLTLHITTSTRMLSFSDPQTNILRLTIAAFAAGVGGADALTVQPFNAAGSAFARRVSRNIQMLLLEESHLAAFCDPAAGAGAFEALTDKIASAAWSRFQIYEREGLVDSIENGSVKSEIEASAKARRAALAAGDRTMIGVTRHPPAERATVRPASVAAPTIRRGEMAGASFAEHVAAAQRGATLADLMAAGARPRSHFAPPLQPQRDAAPFEA